jgi:hypothetical protein
VANRRTARDFPGDGGLGAVLPQVEPLGPVVPVGERHDRVAGGAHDRFGDREHLLWLPSPCCSPRANSAISWRRWLVTGCCWWWRPAWPPGWPGDTEPRTRIVGAGVLWVLLLVADRARRPLLIAHRRAAGTTDVGLFLALLAVAAGPLGELAAGWWAAHVSDARWPVMLAGAGVIMLYAALNPRFDRRRLSWLVVRTRRVFFGLPQIVLICSTLPFLIAGVFPPAQRPRWSRRSSRCWAGWCSRSIRGGAATASTVRSPTR